MSKQSGDLSGQLRDETLAALSRCPAGKALSPSDIAQAVGGPHPDGWGPLMQPLRRVIVALAHEGRLVILRKGKPADPDDFRGIYRIAPPA